MLKDVTRFIFVVDILFLYILMTAIVWSIAFPQKRIWPPPSERSWQKHLVWTCFYIIFLTNGLLIFFDWNSWTFTTPLRFVLSIPLVVIGALFLLWGMRKLGMRNTSGASSGLVEDGPHRFTRNPQYLGDIVLFIGISLGANSLFLWVTHGLLILVLLITPWAEEVWLEEKYGKEYLDYKQKTSRFI